MLLRSLRTLLLVSIVLGLLILSGALAARAIPPSRSAKHSFQPSGHGTAMPQKVDTATMLHTHSTGSTSTSSQQSALTSMSNQQSASGRHSFVPASHPLPQNVVNVPPPGGTDRTAKQGLYRGVSKIDPNGAGGVDNYLETIDQSVGIYTRSGTLQSNTTMQSWFGNNDGYYNPVTMWDDTGSRFLFSVLDSNTNYLWLSVAQQTNAIGQYCNYQFPIPGGGDFDKLGVDSDGIYFSINVLGHNGQVVVSNELFYANRTGLESCQPASYTTWSGLTNPDGTIANALTPARQDTSAGGVEYLINSYPAGACELTLWTLTSSGTLTNASVPTQCYSPPPNAKQKGSSALILTSDCSITQASYVNGLLTVDMPGAYNWKDGNGLVSIVQWYVLNPSTASISSQGAFGTPGYWLFYPSTITTTNGHMLFMYNVSGPGIYPSVWYVTQSMTGTQVLANGTSSMGGTNGVANSGAYQSAWPDASNPNAVWITGEYAKSNNVWGTKFDLVTP